MDEQKNNITPEAEEVPEAREAIWSYPFIVEITAAMILDSCGLERSKQWAEDPALLNNIHVLIDFLRSEIKKMRNEDPELAREGSAFVQLYSVIPGYRPELDPESRAFDVDQYRAAIKEMGQEAFLEGVRVRFAEMIKEQEAITEMLPELEGLAFELQKTLATMYDYLQSDRFREVIRTAREKAEVPAVKNDPRTIARRAEKLLYPVDKVNSEVWNYLSGADPNGQIRAKLRTGRTDTYLVFFSINFDDLDPALKISKKLTAFDKLVYVATAALFQAGSDVISVSQIFREMGNSNRPAPNQIQKIWESLTKMRSAVITMDNQKEIEAGSKYESFSYDGQLLPFERISAYINGTLTDAAIHLFREPPLVQFARERKQVTTIPRKLLESEVSKTEASLQIQDYLLERIGRMKRDPKAPRKILFSTIYENCGIATRNQRSRAPEKVKTFLEHYTKCDWIKGYSFKLSFDGVQIATTKKELAEMRQQEKALKK